MNQASLTFGTDASQFAGYAQTANERLGNFDLIVENTGDIDLYFLVRQYDGTTSPSGYAPLGGDNTIKARGTKTISYSVLSKRIGFFGSGVAASITVPSNATGVGGSTVQRSFVTANVTAVLRNKGDLRGAQIDVTAVGRRGWTVDDGFPANSLRKKWGSVSSTTGVIDSTQDPRNQ